MAQRDWMQYIHNNSLSACRKLGVMSAVQVGMDPLFQLGKPLHIQLTNRSVKQTLQICALALHCSILNMNSSYKGNKIGLLSEGVFEQIASSRPKTFLWPFCCPALSHQMVPSNWSLLPWFTAAPWRCALPRSTLSLAKTWNKHG